jgi:prepilin-type N-terminal cleavage/methylation domain-containing protein
MRADNGFTLIELLATMAIVGILTAIAVPQFSEYKKRGFDTRAQSDLRNVALAEEAYFLDQEEYLSCADERCTDLPGIARISEGVTLEIVADETEFSGTSTHPKGSGKTFEWDTMQGGFVP